MGRWNGAGYTFSWVLSALKVMEGGRFYRKTSNSLLGTVLVVLHQALIELPPNAHYRLQALSGKGQDVDESSTKYPFPYHLWKYRAVLRNVDVKLHRGANPCRTPTVHSACRPLTKTLNRGSTPTPTPPSVNTLPHNAPHVNWRYRPRTTKHNRKHVYRNSRRNRRYVTPPPLRTIK